MDAANGFSKAEFGKGEVDGSIWHMGGNGWASEANSVRTTKSIDRDILHAFMREIGINIEGQAIRRIELDLNFAESTVIEYRITGYPIRKSEEP